MSNIADLRIHVTNAYDPDFQFFDVTRLFTVQKIQSLLAMADQDMMAAAIKDAEIKYRNFVAMHTIGPPVPTEEYTEDQLRNWGIIGLYVKNTK